MSDEIILADEEYPAYPDGTDGSHFRCVRDGCGFVAAPHESGEHESGEHRPIDGCPEHQCALVRVVRRTADGTAHIVEYRGVPEPHREDL